MLVAAINIGYSDATRIFGQQRDMAMPFKQDLSFEEVDNVLAYDPNTGRLLWKVKTAKKIVVGLEAGCVKATRINKAGKTVSYRYIALNGKQVQAARVAWLLHHGEWPLGKLVFLDENPLNLKIDNLRMANSLAEKFDHNDEGERADYMRAHREAHPMDWKDSYLRSKFGISLSEYTALAVEQGNACAICGKKETEQRNGVTKALAVDHDHVNGAVRGLLCVACNTGIGKLCDNPAILRAAADYIERHRERLNNVVPIRTEETVQ